MGVLTLAPKEPIRIAIVSQADPGLRAVRLALRDPSRYMVREYLSLDETKTQLPDFKTDILLLRLPFFSASHVQMLAKVRSHFREAGLVTCAQEIDSMARYQARNIPRLKILQEPSENSDLLQVIEKLKKGEVSSLRQHSRTRRNEEASVLDYGGSTVKARFVDFAQMGARVVVRSRRLFERNDRLQLHYQSSATVGMVHRIEARVVWRGMTGGAVDSIVGGPLQTVGLRFVGML